MGLIDAFILVLTCQSISDNASLLLSLCVHAFALPKSYCITSLYLANHAACTFMASPQLPLVGDSDSELDRSLTTLENFLGFLGFCHYTFLRGTFSWLAFFVLAVAVPLSAHEFSRCGAGCERFEIDTFELEILVSRAVVAAVSLLCVSRNLRRYGVRQALFVDRRHGHTTQFCTQYIRKFRTFYCLLALIRATLTKPNKYKPMIT
ncbi:hypothetical protein ACP275_09G073300 [Erythranthe tilingii]